MSTGQRSAKRILQAKNPGQVIFQDSRRWIAVALPNIGQVQSPIRSTFTGVPVNLSPFSEVVESLFQLQFYTAVFEFFLFPRRERFGFKDEDSL